MKCRLTNGGIGRAALLAVRACEVTSVAVSAVVDVVFEVIRASTTVARSAEGCRHAGADRQTRARLQGAGGRDDQRSASNQRTAFGSVAAGKR